jgi:hypothetical protein
MTSNNSSRNKLDCQRSKTRKQKKIHYRWLRKSRPAEEEHIAEEAHLKEEKLREEFQHQAQEEVRLKEEDAKEFHLEEKNFARRGSETQGGRGGHQQIL